MRRTPERIEREAKIMAAIERSNELVKALEASGRLPEIIESLRAKGYGEDLSDFSCCPPHNRPIL